MQKAMAQSYPPAEEIDPGGQIGVTMVSYADARQMAECSQASFTQFPNHKKQTPMTAVTRVRLYRGYVATKFSDPRVQRN
jgi:hypothetical protein